jgi:hypothetical protein
MVLDTPEAIASKSNLLLLKSISKRAEQSEAVLGPCLRAYKKHIETANLDLIEYLDNLSKWLVEAKDETALVIREKMEKKWQGDQLYRIEGSVTNSLRRSAGTNYQSLVSYALARYFVEKNSGWYLQHPVPKDFREALAILFTANVKVSEEELTGEQQPIDNNDIIEEDEEEDSLPTSFSVQPDVDILLRNAAWQTDSSKPEPVVLLSVKTSLVDRAGMAARWKTYFDLATRPCPHHSTEGCIYDELGIAMQNASAYEITHGIVTANIYKYWFHDASYQRGELRNKQTESNTHMFELKLTTRNDGIAVTPAGWRQLPHIINVLKRISDRYNLPM